GAAMKRVVAGRRIFHVFQDGKYLIPRPASDPEPRPFLHIASARSHGDGGVHARTAAKHLAPDGIHVMTEALVILRVVAPIMHVVAANAVSVENHVWISIRGVSLAALQQGNTAFAVFA